MQIRVEGRRVYLDGKEVGYTALDLRMRPDEYPSIRLETVGEPLIDSKCVATMTDSQLLEAIEARLKEDPKFSREIRKVVDRIKAEKLVKLMADYRRGK